MLDRFWAAVHGRRRTLWTVGIFAVAAVVFLTLLWKLPEYHLRSFVGVRGSKEYFELENAIRTMVAQAGAGIAILVGLYFTWRRVEVAGEGQITERFTRAIDQLGSEKREVRLGGIYALERIANDSVKDHWTIVETLAAYIREKAPWAGGRALEGAVPGQGGGDAEGAVRPAADVQAALTVIGRRRWRAFERRGRWLEMDEQRVDLRLTDLRGASLMDAHLEEVLLTEAHLEGAKLNGAYLEGAELHSAYLNRAWLPGADLRYANLVGTDLSWSYLWGADLEGAIVAGADFDRANLDRANLQEANLDGARNLTWEQLQQAVGYQEATLPDYLRASAPDSLGGQG